MIDETASAINAQTVTQIIDRWLALRKLTKTLLDMADDKTRANKVTHVVDECWQLQQAILRLFKREDGSARVYTILGQLIHLQDVLKTHPLNQDRLDHYLQAVFPSLD